MKNTRVETIDVIFVIALLCVSPMVWLQCLSLWIRPHLQFFPFAWLAFGYIVVVRNDVVTSTLGVRRLASLVAAALSLLLSVEAALISSPWLAYVAAVHTTLIRNMVVDAPRNRIITGSDDKTVRVWQMPEARLVSVLRVPMDTSHEGQIFAVAVSPDGKTIAASGWTGWDWEGSNSIYLF